MSEEQYVREYSNTPAAVPYQSQEGILQYQLETDNIVEEIEHQLKGEFLYYDAKRGEYEWRQKPNARPLINDVGVGAIVTVLKSQLNKIFVLSDLEDEDIRHMTISIGRNMVDDLYFNWDTYQIPSTSAASTIIGLVTNTVYATLRKGYLGNYLKFLRTTQRTTEVQTFSEQPKHRMDDGPEKSMFGLFRRK